MKHLRVVEVVHHVVEWCEVLAHIHNCVGENVDGVEELDVSSVPLPLAKSGRLSRASGVALVIRGLRFCPLRGGRCRDTLIRDCRWHKERKFCAPEDDHVDAGVHNNVVKDFVEDLLASGDIPRLDEVDGLHARVLDVLVRDEVVDPALFQCLLIDTTVGATGGSQDGHLWDRLVSCDGVLLEVLHDLVSRELHNAEQRDVTEALFHRGGKVVRAVANAHGKVAATGDEPLAALAHLFAAQLEVCAVDDGVLAVDDVGAHVDGGQDVVLVTGGPSHGAGLVDHALVKLHRCVGAHATDDSGAELLGRHGCSDVSRHSVR